MSILKDLGCSDHQIAQSRRRSTLYNRPPAYFDFPLFPTNIVRGIWRDALYGRDDFQDKVSLAGIIVFGAIWFGIMTWAMIPHPH
jgi:hypothetical protein